MIMGNQPTPWHWIAGDDYAAIVSKAFATPAAAGKTLYIYGPEALTFEEAMRIYQPICAPEARISKMSFRMLRVISWMPGRGELRHVGLPVMKYFTKVQEIGEPFEANALLGTPSTTVRAWSEKRKAS